MPLMPSSKVFTDLVNALEQPFSPKASAKLLHFRRSLSVFFRFLPNFPNISVFWEYELQSLSFLTLFLVPALYAGLLASSISPDTIRHSPPSALLTFYRHRQSDNFSNRPRAAIVRSAAQERIIVNCHLSNRQSPLPFLLWF